MANEKKGTTNSDVRVKSFELPEGIRGGDIVNPEIPEPSQLGRLDNGAGESPQQSTSKDSVADPPSDSE